MRKDESQLNDAFSDAVEMDRRTVNRAMAWSVPVVMAAVAAPAATGSSHAEIASASGSQPTKGGPVTFTFTFKNISGTNAIGFSSISGSGWGALPTGQTWTVTPTATTVTFQIARTNSGNVGTVTVTLTVNGTGVATPVSVV
jgi:hypothetical protein